jgi:ABC-type antimicrobial peptide transport system permease subunit
MSVGAPLKRLGRQLATESALLVIVAAVLGLTLSVWLGEFLRGLAFLRQAEWGEVTLLDWRVLGLVGAFLLSLALAVSLAPILGLKRLGIAASSRQVAARATIAQRVAGTAQVAIAGTLAGAAIAFAWYLGVLMFGYPGYETRNLYAAQMSVLNRNLGGVTSAIQFQAMIENVVVENARRREAIESLPGVTAVTFGTPIPGAGFTSWSTMPHPRDPTEQIRVYHGMADSRLVDVLGYRLVQGRSPADGDVAVALVNQMLARELFGRDDVVGESLPIAMPGAQSTEIIGVLEDLSFEHPNADVLPYAFLTSNTSFFFSSMTVIESSLTAGELQQALQGLVDSGELELAVQNVRPLRELRANLIAADRGRGLLTILTAALVVFLAGLGFYGTQRYLVTAGRREYAIRASLGAGPRALGRLVLARGLVLSLPGLVIGTLGAFALVAWLRGDFVSRAISPAVVTLAVVAGLILLLLAASLGPARQARRTQPAPLLREE